MPKSNRWKKPLRFDSIEDMPDDQIGVYGFWYRPNGRCIYIGKAQKQSIRTRVTQHWIGSSNQKLNSWIIRYGEFIDICYIPIKSSRIRRVGDLEAKLIRMWSPETNTMLVK